MDKAARATRSVAEGAKKGWRKLRGEEEPTAPPADPFSTRRTGPPPPPGRPPPPTTPPVVEIVRTHVEQQRPAELGDLVTITVTIHQFTGTGDLRSPASYAEQNGPVNGTFRVASGNYTGRQQRIVKSPLTIKLPRQRLIDLAHLALTVEGMDVLGFTDTTAPAHLEGTAEHTAEIPLRLASRTSDHQIQVYIIPEGTAANDAEVRFFLTTLKERGDPENEDDWVAITEPVKYKYAVHTNPAESPVKQDVGHASGMIAIEQLALPSAAEFNVTLTLADWLILNAFSPDLVDAAPVLGGVRLKFQHKGGRRYDCKLHLIQHSNKASQFHIKPKVSASTPTGAGWEDLAEAGRIGTCEIVVPGKGKVAEGHVSTAADPITADLRGIIAAELHIRLDKKYLIVGAQGREVLEAGWGEHAYLIRMHTVTNAPSYELNLLLVEIPEETKEDKKAEDGEKDAEEAAEEVVKEAGKSGLELDTLSHYHDEKVDAAIKKYDDKLGFVLSFIATIPYYRRKENKARFAETVATIRGYRATLKRYLDHSNKDMRFRDVLIAIMSSQEAVTTLLSRAYVLHVEELVNVHTAQLPKQKKGEKAEEYQKRVNKETARRADMEAKLRRATEALRARDELIVSEFNAFRKVLLDNYPALEPNVNEAVARVGSQNA